MERAVALYRDSLDLEVLEHDRDWSEVTAGDQHIGLNASESPAGDGGAVIVSPSRTLTPPSLSSRPRA